jgi:CDP-diacylglycerol--serine O-phosphatidyltransferase
MAKNRPSRRARLRTLRSVAVLPSLLTLGNLLSGFAAVFYASRSIDAPMPWGWTPLTFAAAMIFVGMIFDALDGRLARLTRQTSELGEQLDSMADMVTFGVAPAFIVVQLVGIGTPFFGAESQLDTYFDRIVLILASIYVACAALRLARFNFESDPSGESQHQSFKGLPSPGAAGTLGALVLLHQHLLAHNTSSLAARATAVGLVAITFLTAIAMVSTIRYVHVANRYLRDRQPFHYIVLIVLVVALSVLHFQASLAIGFVVYALSGPVVAGYRWFAGRPAAEESEQAVPADDSASVDHGEDGSAKDHPAYRLRG